MLPILSGEKCPTIFYLLSIHLPTILAYPHVPPFYTYQGVSYKNKKYISI